MLKRGEIQAFGNKVFGRCARCGKLVRMDKPLFGSLHICDETQERPTFTITQARPEEMFGYGLGQIPPVVADSLIKSLLSQAANTKSGKEQSASVNPKQGEVTKEKSE